MTTLKNKIVFITGASSGIGKATATQFAAAGANVLICARRFEKVESLAKELHTAHGVKTHAFHLDVRNHADVERALNVLPQEWKNISILINNAGLSRGMDNIQEGKIADWEEMIDTNVKGLLYVTRAVLPGMIERNEGHIINLGSAAGHWVYPKGNVYNASKFAVRALNEGMKMDLLGTPIRVTSIDPGLVETEFSIVRFSNDTERAKKVYQGLTPLTPDDIAETIVWTASRPAHVNISSVIMMPTDQASPSFVHRRS
ncbi:MAG: SDR family oxidoreductase [Bacteriovoracaceae bacterium]|nr:SDR family oxidoreductase [Bacteroidota bacterium]